MKRNLIANLISNTVIEDKYCQYTVIKNYLVKVFTTYKTLKSQTRI